MKPFKYLLFLFTIISICLLILFLFPKSGVSINDNFKLKFLWDFINTNDSTPKYANINPIIKQYEKEIESVKDTNLTKNITSKDSLNPIVTTKRRVKKANTQAIEYPFGDSTVLYSFFKKLNLSAKKRMRIFHYGDSQIEGDRISGYLRNKFQKRFGGSGPGLITALPRHAPSSSIIHKASKNWVKHAVYHKKDTALGHRKFGLLGSFARFTPYKNDTNTVVIKKAWIEFNRSGMAYRSVKNFTQCRVFFSNAPVGFTVKGFVDDELKWFEEIDSSKVFRQFNWDFAKSPKNFRIEWEATKSPDIYAIALDTYTGVAVDNLPFRGSSGSEFTKLDYNQAKKMTKHLNTGLIILQFGVNVVPYVTKNYGFYERMLTRQIKYIKKIFKNTPILIVSLSDMSKKQGNNYVSYPNIVKIKQVQKNVAKLTNCAFWDLHKAMGGENSMSQWVNATPPLATKDFIHFNRRGGNFIAQMIFNALMYEYDNYNEMQKQLTIKVDTVTNKPKKIKFEKE